MLVRDTRPASADRLDPDVTRAVTELARAMVALRPIAEAGHDLFIAGSPAAGVEGFLTSAEVLCVLAERAGQRLSGPYACPGRAGCECGERCRRVSTGPRFAPVDAIVAGRLGPASQAAELARVPVSARDELARLAAEVVAEGFDRWRHPVPAVGAGGVPLRSYAAGDPERPAVIVASACGMPAELCEPWMRHLAEEYRVITWETRGLFGGPADPADFDGIDHGVPAQAADLLAVLDLHGVDRAHVMGLCGGAVIALAAAAAYPDRIASLSLWHGDFSGSACPSTEHQQNLKALMEMALTSREDAAAINGALMGTALAAVEEDVAHLVIYPYLSAELFYRYCALTNPTMTIDTEPMLAAVTQPCLMVTSEDDHTAHPAGSHHVAAGLLGVRLHVEPHGDHLSVFGAGAHLRQLLRDFLEQNRISHV